MNTVIEHIVLTEKAAKSVKSGKYTFDIAPDVNKVELKKFIEDQYKVKVKDINILNRKGKNKQRGRKIVQLKDTKRAIVTLAEGQTIEKVKSLF